MPRKENKEESGSPCFVSGNVVGCFFFSKDLLFPKHPPVKVWAKRTGSPAWPALVTGREESGKAACLR